MMVMVREMNIWLTCSRSARVLNSKQRLTSTVTTLPVLSFIQQRMNDSNDCASTGQSSHPVNEEQNAAVCDLEVCSYTLIGRVPLWLPCALSSNILLRNCMRRNSEAMMMLWSLLLALAGSFLLPRSAAEDAKTNHVAVHFRNEGGLRIQVGWINPKDQSIHSIGIMDPFATFQMNSFSGHQFQLLELPLQSSGRCKVMASHQGSKSWLETKEGCAVNKFRASKEDPQCTFYELYYL